MRLVVGAVVSGTLARALWSDPPLHISHRLGVARTGGAPSHRRVMDASRWSGGRRRRDLRDPHDGRTSRWPPASSNHRRRADDARTRPVVDRRPALRMEAHRSTTAPVAFERALSAALSTTSNPFAPSSKSSGNASRRDPKESRKTPVSVVPTTPYERMNAPERRLWQPLRTPTIAQKQGGQ